MKVYEVTIPIAGHAFITLEAASAEEAIEMAMDEVSLKHVEEWEALDAFHQGNVCYCPSPWRAEATEVSDE